MLFNQDTIVNILLIWWEELLL